VYQFSKTIHSLIWEKILQNIQKQKFHYIKWSNQDQPNKIQHHTTQSSIYQLNQSTTQHHTSKRPKSKKFQNKTQTHNGEHRVVQQLPSTTAPPITTHSSSSNLNSSKHPTSHDSHLKPKQNQIKLKKKIHTHDGKFHLIVTLQPLPTTYHDQATIIHHRPRLWHT